MTTPTTHEVRVAWSEFDGHGDTVRSTQTFARAEFDRWLSGVKAEAWAEGFVAGVNADMGDYEHPPESVTNPYTLTTEV